jgi:hypothetical protein
LLKNEIEATSIIFLSAENSLKNETKDTSIVFLLVTSSLKNETKIWGLNPDP